MSDELFREVDEEVRQDRFQQLWKRYSAIGLAVVVLIVVLTFASVFCTVRCFAWLFSFIRQHAVSPTSVPNKEVGEDD